MPGIFDILAAQGLLNFFNQPSGNRSAVANPTDTGDETSRLLRRSAPGVRQPATPIAAAMSQPTAAPQATPAAAQTAPALTQVTAANGSFDMPDVALAIQQAKQGPVVPAEDPYASSPAAQQAVLDTAMRESAGDGTPTWVRALEAAGRGLTIAGSQDPLKAFTQISELDKADRASRKPKVTPLADGAFSMITMPDGSVRYVKNEEVAQYLGDKQQRQFEQALQKVILGGQVQANTAANKAAITTAEEARPILNDVNSLMDRWNQAKEIVSGQGTKAQIQGAFPTIAGFFGGDQVAANKFLEGLTVDETLLNTARTKGAISNQEMTLFKAPIPSLTDDREKVWKPWIEKRLEVLGKLKTFAEGQVARGAAAGGGGSAATPAPTPAPASSGGMTVPGLSPNASKYFK